MTQPPLLSIRGVETYYGNIRALKTVDLECTRARSSRSSARTARANPLS